jgi:hypothetical protein
VRESPLVAWAISVGGLLVLLAAALVCNGYSIGLADHFIHLPYLLRAMDPGYLHGDLLVESAERHLSLFWILQAPVVETFGLEPTYLVIQLASWLMMLAGLVSLARALAPAEHGRLAGWLACIPAVLVPVVFGWIRSFDNHVLNRTIVMGGELFALALAIRGRGFASFLLIGVLVNIHATTAVHTAAFAGCLIFVHPDRWWQIARAFAGLVIGALPLIVMTLAQRGAGAAAMGLDYAAWRDVVELHFPFHHFVAWMDSRQAASLIIATVALVAAWRKTGNPAWASMLVAMLVLTVGNLVATEVLHLRIGTVLHLYEAGRLLTYLGFVAAPVVLIAARADSRRTWVASIGLLVAVIAHGLLSQQFSFVFDNACMVLAVASAAALSVPCAHADRGPRRLPPAWSALVAALALSAFASYLRGDENGFGYRLTDVRRGEAWSRSDFTPPDSPLPIDVINGMPLMRWARANLPVDAIVVTPPFLVHPLTNFRFHARRSLLVTHKDGGEATFDSVFAKRWHERMEAILGEIPAPREYGRDGFAARRREMHRRYNDGDEARFRSLGARFGVTHGLCPRAARCGALDFPIVYEDAAWRVFEIPP